MGPCEALFVKLLLALVKPYETLSVQQSLNHFFNYHTPTLLSFIACSTICRHSSRVVAFLQAVVRLKFRGPRSASIARSQVWLSLPIGRFQSAARARWWSSLGKLQALWPTLGSHLHCPLSYTHHGSGQDHLVFVVIKFLIYTVFRNVVILWIKMPNEVKTTTSKLQQKMVLWHCCLKVQIKFVQHNLQNI